MINFLLDTNICIYIIKNKPVEVFEKFRNLQIGSVGISSITLAEMQYGVQKSSNRIQNQAALNEFIIPVEVITFDERAAFIYGEIRYFLEKIGKPIGSLDLLIAAQAKSMDVTLISNNTKEFERIPGLKIDNWVN